jgi:hypothetical protein
MSNKPTMDEDAARYKRVLQQLSEVTVDEWEAKIAYYAAETAKLELIEQSMMTSTRKSRTRSNRPRANAAPTAPVKPTLHKVKVAK